MLDDLITKSPNQPSYTNQCCGVYLVINILNKKIYVGSSKTIWNRWKEHQKLLRQGKHANPHLQNSWNLNGKSSFSFIFIEETTKEALYEREQFYIDNLKVCDREIGYNINKLAQGGRGNPKSELERKKQSERMKGNQYAKGNKIPREIVERNAAKLRGRKCPDYLKNLLSKANSKPKPQYRGEGNPSAKLNLNQVIEIKKLLNKKWKRKDIAKKYKVSISAITSIATKKSWSHI